MTDPTPPSSQPAVDPALTARIKNEKARWDQVIHKLKLSLD